MVALAARSRLGTRWIGLDIGSTSMKVAVIEPTPAGPRLVKYAIQALPVSEEAQVIDRMGWLHSTLNELSAREVHVVVGGADVLLRRMLLPLMSANERTEAAKWHLKDEVSFPIQQAIVDAHVLGDVWDKDVKKSDVLVALVSDEAVRHVMALVEGAGARVLSVTPSLLAMCCCATQLVPEASTGSIAVIEIGASDTHVAVMKDGRVRVTRELHLGSAHLTESLVGVVSSERGDVTIDHLTAEMLKRRHGILGDGAQGSTEDGVPLFHLASLMRPILEQLVTELSRFFDFYTMQMHEAGVSRVLVCGGGAQLKSLPAFLSEGLGISVELMNPLMRLTDRALPLEPEPIAQDGPRLAVALGAAFNHGQGLTLLPLEIRQGQDAAVASRVLRLGARVLLGVVLAGAMTLQATAMRLSARLRAQEAIWAQMQPTDERGRNAIARTKQLGIAIQQVEGFVNQQPIWAGVLKELGALTPPTVQLDECVVTRAEAGAGNRFHLRASVVNGDAGASHIAQWIDAMEQSLFFAHVQLVSSEMRSTGAGPTHVEVEGTLE